MMKKPFLLIALAATAAVMSAQTFKPIPELEEGRILSVGEPAMTCRNIGNIQQRAPKSVSTGVYYNRPVGTFYYPTSQVTYLLVPPLADMTFRNASKSKRATVWYKDGEPQTADYDYNFTTNYAIPDDPERLFRFPYLKLGADTFALGDGNNSNYTNGVVINSKVQNLAYFDMSLTGGYYSMFTGGSYIFGTGSSVVGGKTFTHASLIQYMDEPATPLMLSSIKAPAITTNADSLAIHSGYYLESRIFSLDEEGNLDELIGTLRCRPSNITYGTSRLIKGSSLTYRPLTLEFVPVQSGAVMINKPYAVVILGFNSPGVDVGLAMNDLGSRTNDNPDFDILEPTYTIPEENSSVRIYTSGEKDNGIRYCYNVVIWLNGMLEPMSLITSNDYNVLTAPTEGGYALNQQNLSPKFLSPVIMPGNYELDDVPDWLTPQLEYDKRFENKTTTIKLYADELPEEIGYRKAEISIRKISNGAIANDKIIVEQGDPSGVEVVNDSGAKVVDTAYYDLLGRKITQPNKGSVVIKTEKYSDGTRHTSKVVM